MRITCKGKSYEVPSGLTLMDIYSRIYGEEPHSKAVLADVDGVLSSLNTVIDSDAEIRWVPMNSKAAMQAYQRTMIMLLVSAVKEIYGEDADVKIKHSLGRAFYCEFPDKHVPMEQELKVLEEHMLSIVKEKREITPTVVGKKEAIEYLYETGREKDVALLKMFSGKLLGVYQCGNLADYYMGPMLPHMGYIRTVHLKSYAPGFLLFFDLNTMNDYNRTEDPLFARLFLEAEEWAELIGCQSVVELNQAIENHEEWKLIAVAEALQEKKMAKLADRICQPWPKIRMICIAGPSSAGKTTFMSRLMIHLWVNGVKPVKISLDDYFLDHDKENMGKSGSYENLDALDVPLFQKTIAALLEGKEVLLPRFNFKTGKREWNDTPIHLEKNQPVMVEGLHALNPVLTQFVPGYQCMHIYLGALTQLSINNHNRISTTDTRLIRRMVRDSWSRSNNPERTLAMWKTVRQGEEKNIFHFQNRAEVIFNTALLYEIPVLKTMAVPLLKSIGRDSSQYDEAQRLLRFLEPFREIPCSEVPENSILREFIGKKK